MINNIGQYFLQCSCTLAVKRVKLRALLSAFVNYGTAPAGLALGTLSGTFFSLFIFLGNRQSFVAQFAAQTKPKQFNCHRRRSEAATKLHLLAAWINITKSERIKLETKPKLRRTEPNRGTEENPYVWATFSISHVTRKLSFSHTTRPSSIYQAFCFALGHS